MYLMINQVHYVHMLGLPACNIVFYDQCDLVTRLCLPNGFNTFLIQTLMTLAHKLPTCSY